MNQIIDSFPEILDFAKNYHLPVTKKRAILREYLQSKILREIYKNKLSVNLLFVGGTSLRLLHNLDRFSEDLDFDFEESFKQQLLSAYPYAQIEEVRIIIFLRRKAGLFLPILSLAGNLFFPLKPIKIWTATRLSLLPTL